MENVIRCMQEVFIEYSSLHRKLCYFSKFFQTFNPFWSFDTPISCILKKYRSFVTVHYTLVPTSAVFAKLKQLKANCLGNRHSYRQAHWQTTVTLAMCPRTVRLITLLSLTFNRNCFNIKYSHILNGIIIHILHLIREDNRILTIFYFYSVFK